MKAFNAPRYLDLSTARDWYQDHLAGAGLRMLDFTPGAAVDVRFDSMDADVLTLKNGSGIEFPPPKPGDPVPFRSVFLRWDAQAGASCKLIALTPGAEFLPGALVNTTQIIDGSGNLTGTQANPLYTAGSSKDSTGAVWAVGPRIVKPSEWVGAPNVVCSAGTSAGALVLGGSAVPAGKRWIVGHINAAWVGASNGKLELRIKDNLGTVLWYRWIPVASSGGAGVPINLLDFLGGSGLELLSGWSIEYTSANTSQFSITASYIEMTP